MMVKEKDANLYDVDDWDDNDDDNEDHHDNDDIEKKKEEGGWVRDHFSLQISLCQIEKQLKLDQRTAHICRFLVKVTRISVSRCTRLK